MLTSTAGSQLNIHTSDRFLPTGVPHVTMLYPFWGMPRGGRQRPEIFDQFIRKGMDLFSLGSPKDADFFLLPFDWRYTSLEFAETEREALQAKIEAQRFSDLANDLNKKLIVFFVSDSDAEVSLENALVFRTSLRRDLRPNEFAMAVFIDDFLGERLGSDLPLRPKLQCPSVGFCGFAGYRT
ncbi:MAG: hypothetical protein ACREA0_24930, partial [bacterium]